MRKGLVLLVAAALTTGCAKKGSPGGGPEDKAGPFVAQWSPVAGTDSVSADRPVELSWSEPVQRSTVEDNLIVSPDTSVVDLNWKGQTLSVIPRGGWLAGTPQWVGPGVLDRHGIPAEEVFGTWFTTADTVFATMVEGQVNLVGDAPAANSLVRFKGDESPLAWTCVANETGSFAAAGLDPGQWCLEAFVDLNRDGRYARGIEPWGSVAVMLASDSVVSLTLVLAPEDTAPPVIREVRADHAHQVRIGFSEPLGSVDEHAFALHDTAGDEFSLAATVLTAADPAAVRLMLAEALRDDVIELIAGGVQDSAGLAMAETTVVFMGTSVADTVAPTVYRMGYDQGQPSRLWLMFSEPMAVDTAESLTVWSLPALRRASGQVSWRDPQVLTWSAAVPPPAGARLLMVLAGARDAGGLPMIRPLVRLVPTPADSLVPDWDTAPLPGGP